MNYQIKESKLLSEKYYAFTHKSGLRVYVFSKEMTTSYAMFSTEYGSIDNKFKLATDHEYTTVTDGIAHFLEHKLFECEDGTDAFERYAKTGASANAFTSNTQTSYLFSATENFYESLEILLDFVTHPFFSEQTVKKEQGIIGQELRMYDDSPSARLERGLLESLYEKNKMRIDVGGTIESISHITADLLYRCYRTFYNLHNMVLVVCGRVTPEETEKVCDKILTEQPSQTILRDYEDEDEPKEVFKKRAECRLEVSKPTFAIGIKDGNISKDPMQRLKKAYANEILNDMLFSQSSEFYNRLVNTNQVSPDFSANYEHTKHASFNVISADADYPENVYNEFVSYVKEVQEKGLDKESFELSKRSVYASFIKSFDSTEEIANGFTFNLFDGVDLLDTPEVILSVSFEDVCDLLTTLYQEQYYTMSVVYPIEKEKKC